VFHPQVHCALGIARVARQCAGTDTESLYQLFSSVGKVRGAATSDHVKNIVATKEDCKKKSTFGTRAGSSVQMQENAKAERPDTDDRASSTRSIKPRILPQSKGRRKRDRETTKSRKNHVERVTPANYARRKFAPPCWTTVRGAQYAPNSNAAPDGSIRKTPCRARAYHAAAGRTTINRGGGGV
jgi:hypothetical protein